ncbi:MAG: hypothetical protein SFU57_08180 [Gemmatimonadales bacterium]|nr:hypothetical protein [Gemmatimonadales bacterium]
MMLYRRVFGMFALATLVTLPASSQVLRDDSHTWKLGLQGGSMVFQTRTQDYEAVPSVGAHLLIMAKRGGLMVGVDEGFGDDEQSGQIVFNDIRRYQAVLMAFPVAGKIEPYFGAGGGLLQVVGPRVSSLVTDPLEREALLDAADDATTHAFATFLAGVQGKWGRSSVFVQTQISTAPGSDKLLRGALYSFHGGIRIGLGSTREDVRAGGY